MAGREPFIAAARDPVLYFVAAAARRGAPLRHRLAPRAPQEGDESQPARRDRRHRPDPQARAAHAFRHRQGGQPRRRGRPDGGGGYLAQRSPRRSTTIFTSRPADRRGRCTEFAGPSRFGRKLALCASGIGGSRAGAIDARAAEFQGAGMTVQADESFRRADRTRRVQPSEYSDLRPDRRRSAGRADFYYVLSNWGRWIGLPDLRCGEHHRLFRRLSGARLEAAVVARPHARPDRRQAARRGRRMLLLVADDTSRLVASGRRSSSSCREIFVSGLREFLAELRSACR